MLSGVPNLAFALGYTNASWTLKCDLTCEYVCRLLNHMDEHGYAHVHAAQRDPTVEPTQPFIDLNSGYVLRAIDQFPKQGRGRRGGCYQNYARDIVLLRHGALEDEGDGVLAPPARPCPSASRLPVLPGDSRRSTFERTGPDAAHLRARTSSRRWTTPAAAT